MEKQTAVYRNNAFLWPGTDASMDLDMGPNNVSFSVYMQFLDSLQPWTRQAVSASQLLTMDFLSVSSINQCSSSNCHGSVVHNATLGQHPTKTLKSESRKKKRKEIWVWPNALYVLSWINHLMKKGNVITKTKHIIPRRKKKDSVTHLVLFLCFYYRANVMRWDFPTIGVNDVHV